MALDRSPTIPHAHRLTLAGLSSILAVAGAAVGCVPAPTTTATPPAVTLSSTLDRGAVLVGGDGLVRAELVLRGRDARPGGAQAVPTDLVVVFDRSGSMHGTKIEDARRAVHELVSQLGPADRFALVSYASEARIDLPLAPSAPSSREAWGAIIDRLEATTGTNMVAGLDLGAAELSRTRQAGHVARVILVSDGLANEGDATLEGLSARARRIARSEGVMSTVGVGLDFDERVMTSLADAGTGNFYFVEEAMELAGVFRSEFGAARETVASAASVTVRPAEGVQLVDAAGYPLEWNDGAATFRPGSLFAGQERRVWLTLRAPTAAVGARSLAKVSLSFVEDGRPVAVAARDLGTVRCIADEARVVAAIDKGGMGRSVVSEEYRSLQQAVSQSVKEGKKDEARMHIEGYVRVNGYLNASVQSKDVAANLEEAKRLEAQVDDAFSGENQGMKQQSMSKQQWSAGQDGRRCGAKKQ